MMLKQKISNHLCGSIVMICCFSFQALATEQPLAIDTGHITKHPGAVSARGESEFNFNAALASVVSDLLAAQGESILRIGQDGKMETLKNRTSIANDAQAKFFLSIHHDSVQPLYLKHWTWNGTTQQYSNYAHGFSLFVSRKNPESNISLNCAAAIGKALKEKGLSPSPHHAEAIAGENRPWADQENGVYFYDDLVVLKTAAMPAVLLEAGVIVNKEEESILQTSERRYLIAMAIQTGLQHCGILK